jgi:hypothetical protein
VSTLVAFIGSTKEKKGRRLWSGSKKDLHLEIEIQLSRVLKSREARASDVKTVFAVVGGDHGDMAFQYGVAITAELQDGEQLYFEVCCCKLICRKDTSVLLEKTILPHLTTGLKIISTQPLNIYLNANDTLLCTSFTPLNEQTNNPVTIQVSVFITGNLAFQAMIMGIEAMSGHHCLMCQLIRKEFNDDRHAHGLPWTFPELVCIGKEVNSNRTPQQGVKQEPQWLFLKFEHHMVPLLHCLIGISNNLLDKFCDIINEFIKKKN